MELETDQQVGLSPASVATTPESDRTVGLAPANPNPLQVARQPEPEPESGVKPIPISRPADFVPPYGEETPATFHELLADASTPGITFPHFQHKPDDHPLLTVGKEVGNVALSIPEFFTSGLGVASLVSGGMFPAVTAGLFTVDMLNNLGKGVTDTYKNWHQMTPQQKIISIVDLGATGVMALAAGRGTVEGAKNAYAGLAEFPGLAERRAATQAEFERNLAPTARMPRLAGPLEFPADEETITPTERTQDATGIRQQRSSEEAQLQGIREGQDLQTYPAEVRQAPGGQAAGGGGPVPAAEVPPQVAPAPDEQLLTPPVQPAAPVTTAAAQLPPITTEMIAQGRSLIDRAYALNAERQLSDADRVALGAEIENVRRGDFSGMQAQLERLRDAPLKPPKVVRRFTAFDRFNRETEEGGPDILSWISQNMRMLSRSGAKKIWGKERYETNKSLWDDAPDDMPMHHVSSIYGGRSGPDVVAQTAYDSGIIPAPDVNVLWARIRAASRKRRGMAGEAEREEQLLSRAEQELMAWQESTRQREGAQPITTDDIGDASVLHIGDQRIEVAGRDPETGAVTLNGGERFGTQTLNEGETIYVDRAEHQEGEPEFAPAEEPAAPPAQRTVAEINADIERLERELRESRSFTPTLTGEHQGLRDQLTRLYVERQLAERATAPVAPAAPVTPEAPTTPEAPQREGARGPWLGRFLDDSFSEAQKGYPKAREALKGWSDADLAAEKAEMTKASLNPMFGRNAERVLRLIQDEIDARKPAPTTKFGGAAPVGTRVDNYVKDVDAKGEGRWYLLDEDGNRRNVPPANAKKHKQLEAQAALPPPPAETRTPLEVLNQASKVKFTVPKGTTMLRVTDADGRVGVYSVEQAEEERNLFRGAGITRIEAGRIVRSGQFEPIEGEVGVADVGSKTARMVAPEPTATPLAVENVQAHLAQQYGVRPGGIVDVVDNIVAEWRGESEMRVIPGSQRGPDGLFPYEITRIRLNAFQLTTPEEINQVFEHELAHGAAEQIKPVLNALTSDEVQAILKDVRDREYPVAELRPEFEARAVTALVDSWRQRNWFEKVIGTVMAWANKIGVPLTRLAAERIAARAIADQLTLVKRGSIINQPAVERVVHSLPNNAEEWGMKQFFNAIGLQAGTIGGYLHRYTRQVDLADRLEVSDRARALDEMNKARQLTELAQGMGGRANYYDALQNAASQGERSEVIKSAFESVMLYQQVGVDLRRKLGEKQAILQSAAFRNKLERASRARERAELAEEVRQTYTLQVAGSAGRIMQTLNNLRTVGAAQEQLQADLARVQQLPQFERAVQQHFDDIVNRLAQSDRGISLLLGGGDRNGQEIWDEYMRQRFANNLGIPQGNEFVLGQLASAVLSVNRDLRNQFGSLALLSRDIITTQEWNRAASKIAQAIQNDPVKAIPRILQRAGTLGEREARAEAAWLTLNKGIQRVLRDYSEHEEAVRLHDAVEADPEYRRWVNDVLQNPSVQGLLVPPEVQARLEAEGKPAPFFKYTGADTIYSPDGKPYQINLQFTPENVQETMGILGQFIADVSDWLDRPENQDNPSRLYWQERQQLMQGVLMSSAIWNPGAIKPLFFEKSFGIPESFYQTLALPASKLTFLAIKAADRYWAQGTGWFRSNQDLSERAIQLAYKEHGFNEINRKAYQRAVLNAIGWEFRNGRDVRVGDIINGVKITEKDLALLRTEGKMTNDLYDRMWNTAKNSGAERVMELPRLIDEFGSRAWGTRRPMEIGLHANTTLPHHFSDHGRALANLIHSRIAARNAELEKLPQRVVAEGMDEAAQNAARADINTRFYQTLIQDLNDPDIFQNAVLGFMRQRSENWVKLDGLSPFEEHYREITRLVSQDDPTAPKTVEQVLDWITQRMPEEVTPDQVRTQFFNEWQKLTERFYKMHSDGDTGVRVQTDKRTTVFTKGFQQDLGPAYFYDYGWMNAGEMRQYSTDMGEFGLERMLESMHALRQNIREAVAELTSAAEGRKPEIVRRTMEQYKQGKDFRNLQTLEEKGIELDRQIAGIPNWYGANAVHAEGISLKSFNRFVSFMIGAALTGPRTAARISGISMGGSAWKMGIVFSNLGFGMLRSFPTAAASAITSAFRVGTATGLGWYHPGKGFVPGVPLRLLMNIPGAARAGLAAKGSERLYSAIEAVLKGVTDEQFSALGWWFDQKALGMTPDTAIGARVANIISASLTKGGVLATPQKVPVGATASVLRGAKLAVSKPWAMGEAFVAGTNVYLPGAFGYNITYDAVGRQAGWYIDALAANARRTFNTYERLGQLDRFNFDNLTDPRNKLQPWEVLPSFAGRFRFADPAKLPGWARPNSTNLQFARELFSTSTDVDLQDLILRYWKRLSETPAAERGRVEFLAPEEIDPVRATEIAEGRARGIVSRFVEQTHHAAPSNRPYQLQKAPGIQAILPFIGWSAQTLKLIDTTLGRAAFSTERAGIQADTYSALAIAAGMTAVGVGAFAFAGGDLEARLIRQLDRLLHNKEGTVKTIDEARDTKEAAEITLHNMTAGIPMLNSTLNQLFGMTGYRGGNVGFQAFAFDKVNSMLTYARDVYRTHDLTHGLDRLAEANIPISETIIENTFQRQGLQNNRNAVRVLQKFGPQDLVERRASLSIALPTEMTPYRQALLEAVGSGDQALVAETYQAFIQKATELGRTDPDKLARQMFSTLNPYRQAFGGVLTDQQRADSIAKMSDAQRGMVETMEKNYALAAATLGLTADFEKQEKAPPLQRSGAAAGGGGAISLPSGRAAAVGGGGLSRIGTGLRRVSLSGPKPPRIRLPGVSGVSGARTGGNRLTASRIRTVHGRLRARTTKARRLTARRPSRRRVSLYA